MSAPSERWQRLEELFHAALELPAAERAAFLDKACGANAKLRVEIEHLLGADAAAQGRLERIVAQGARVRPMR